MTIRLVNPRRLDQLGQPIDRKPTSVYKRGTYVIFHVQVIIVAASLPSPFHRKRDESVVTYHLVVYHVHVLPVQHSREVLRYNCLIVTAIFSC